MKILSLFDGISCARVALERLGIPVEVYYASEIDKYAIQISKKNYPDIIQLGDITQIKFSTVSPFTGNIVKIKSNYTDVLGRRDFYSSIDLLIGGSPCQDLSIAKKNREGLDGSRSSLFWEYVRILNEVKPKYFILENVASMPKEAKQIITETLGVEPIMINASLVSAQNRKRLFWTNIKFELPEDKKIVIADVLKIDVEDKQNKIITTKIENNVKIRKNYIDTNELCIFLRKYKNKTIKEIAQYCEVPLTKAEHWFRQDNSFAIPEAENWNSLKECLNITTDEWDKKITEFEIRKGKYDMSSRIYNIKGKHPTITTISGGHQLKTITDGKDTFFLEIEHYEEMQGLPNKYTEGISLNQRRKVLGNAFNVDVVAHILSFIK